LTRRFDSVCNRTLARTVNATHEFDARDLEIIPALYPVELVSKFERNRPNLKAGSNKLASII
jgi:hypothetical protein